MDTYIFIILDELDRPLDTDSFIGNYEQARLYADALAQKTGKSISWGRKIA